MANWWDKNLTDKQKFRLQEPKDPSLLDVVSTVPNPVGDVASGLLAAQDVSKGNYGTAALNSLGLLPFIPSMGGVVKNVGKSAKTEFESAHDLAQQRAALPISEGGLGLPANNTAMDRAKAIGFEGAEYHTTDAENIDNIYNQGFSNIHRGERNFTSLGDEYGGDRYYSTGVGNYTSDNPFASEFTSQGKLLANKAMLPLMINKSKHFDYTNPEHIKDLMTPRKTEGLGQGEMNPADLKALQEGKHNVMEDWMTTMNLKKRGYTGTNLKEPKQYYGGEGTTTNTFDPSLFRSKFAAFDPFRRNEADILAGVAPLAVGSLLGLNTYNNMQDKPKKEIKKTK